MKIKYIELYCDNDDTHNWVLLESKNVEITLSLKNDEYQFKAICPICKKTIFNTRLVK